MKERHGRAASLVIEEGSISHGLIQSLREKHINVVDYKPKGDKQERLISQIDLFEGGSVLLPREAPWLEAFVAEFAAVSWPARRSGRRVGAGTRLATRGMEGAASSAKSNRNGRLNHCPVWSIKIRDL